MSNPTAAAKALPATTTTPIVRNAQGKRLTPGQMVAEFEANAETMATLKARQDVLKVAIHDHYGDTKGTAVITVVDGERKAFGLTANQAMNVDTEALAAKYPYETHPAFYSVPALRIGQVPKAIADAFRNVPGAIRLTVGK